MAYDPRTDTGIPTEPVGSLPRPSKLQDAYAKYDAGEIDKEALEAEQDEAVKDSISHLEQTGLPIVSDGEQRWSSFATYPITDTLAGTGLADNLAPDGQFFAIFADGHGRQLPRVTGGPFKYKTYAADTLKKSIQYASKPMKQAVIAPSMIALLYPLSDEVDGYSQEDFENDVINECEKDIRQAFDAGAERVSVDFTEGRLATRNDPKNPWTGAGLLPHFIELNNRVMERFTPEERVNIGIHTCPGGRPRLGSLRRRPVQQPVARDVQDQRRLLPDPALLRAGQGPGLRVDRQASARRRRRRLTDDLHRRHQPAEPAGGERRGGPRRARPGRGLHPQGEPRLYR